MASFPGRKFKKVPPKGKKPLGKPLRKEPFAPTYYEPFLFDEGAWEQFYNDINPVNLPRNVYTSLAKNINASLSARYRSAREKEINIETTEQELYDLPGSSGSGISVNLKDWLENPEDVLKKTTSAWWKSVFNWEDFEQAVELETVWVPLLQGDNGALKSHLSTGTTLGLVERVGGSVQGRGSPLAVDLGNSVDPDFYKRLATDIQIWGSYRGTRDSRLGYFENLQVDLLTAVDTRLGFSDAELSLLSHSSNRKVKSLADNFIELRQEVIGIKELPKFDVAGGKFGPNKISVAESPFEVARGVAGSGAVVKGRAYDLLDPKTKAVTAAFESVAGYKSQVTAGLSALTTPFVPEGLVVAGSAIQGIVDPKIRNLRNQALAIESAKTKMLRVADRAFSSVTDGGQGVLSAARSELGLIADPLLDLELERLVTWAQLTQFRERQSVAHDFLEAIDSKSFFKMFMWTGELANHVPGLSTYAKFLDPRDYLKLALDKVGYFGLTDTFDEADSRWKPFAHLARAIERFPVVAKATQVLTLGLVGSENFAYIKFGGGLGTLFIASDFSKLGMNTDDWQILKGIVNTKFNGKAIPGSVLGTIINNGAARDSTLDFLSTLASSQGQKTAASAFEKAFTGLTPGARDPRLIHFANLMDNPQFRNLLTQNGIMDAFGNIDATKFNSFWDNAIKARLDQRYIGFVTSIGRRLDHYQSVAIEKVIATLPFMKKPISFFRGNWVNAAVSNRRIWAAQANAWIMSKGGALVAKLGIKGALKVGLKVLAGVLTGTIETISNALPVIGPIIVAGLAWIAQKLLGKIWGAVKGPVLGTGKALYNVAIGSWLFTDYGFLGTGESSKAFCCGCGCLFIALLSFPMIMLVVIGAANVKFADEGLTPVVSENIAVSKTVSPAQISLNTSSLVTYTITVRNIGTDTLIGLSVTDSYPNPDNIVTGSTCNGELVTAADQKSISPGGSQTFTCTLTINSATDRFLTNSLQAAASAVGSGAVKSVNAVATATLKIGDPKSIAPCGWPGDANLLRYPPPFYGSGQPNIEYGCNWGGHASRPAVDIPYERGRALLATIEGEATRCVITTEEGQMGDSYGIYVDVVGADYTVRYGHLSPEFPADSALGCRSIGHKDVGELVGKSGNTGKSSGPHLHYEVIKNGVPVCPENYIDGSIDVCGGSEPS